MVRRQEVARNAASASGARLRPAVTTSDPSRPSWMQGSSINRDNGDRWPSGGESELRVLNGILAARQSAPASVGVSAAVGVDAGASESGDPVDGEGTGGHNLKRKRTAGTRKCSRCGGQGHFQKKCPNPCTNCDGGTGVHREGCSVGKATREAAAKAAEKKNKKRPAAGPDGSA